MTQAQSLHHLLNQSLIQPHPQPVQSALHAFEPLTPDLVMDALASVGLYGDGRLMALSSYENRVYQLHLEDGQVVVAKFYRPGRWTQAQILEEHSFSAELMAAEIPVIGPLRLCGTTLNHFGGFAFSVSQSRGGRPPELDSPEVLEWVGRFLARIHTVGAMRPFVERPALSLPSFGVEPRDWLLNNDILPLDVQRAWADMSKRAIEAVASFKFFATPQGQPKLTGERGERGEKAKNADHLSDLSSGADQGEESEESHNADGPDNPDNPDSAIAQIRLHGDVHPGNILWTPVDVPPSAGPGPHFVDLDDARTGPAVQDFWMLLSGDRQQRSRQLGALVDGYEQFREFDRRELALIEPLRTLRLMHYSAWLARRWADPTFPINFPWFGTSDYWKGQVLMLEEQIEAMQDAPLVV